MFHVKNNNGPDEKNCSLYVPYRAKSISNKFFGERERKYFEKPLPVTAPLPKH